MADISKRFVYASKNGWYGIDNANKQSNETTYNDSVVFIHNGSNKGLEIYTHGNYFKTDVALDDVKPLIDGYLSAGENITVTSKDGKLEIAAVSTSTLTGKTTSTELVQAQAVVGALTSPIELTLEVANGVGTFTEKFSTLGGEDVNAVSAIIEAGDNITIETGDKGLKISANFEETTYSAGSGLELDGTTFKHKNSVTENEAKQGDVTLSTDTKSFTFDQYSYDTEGHIKGKVTNTVTLPDTAFTDTTYTGSNTIDIDENNQVSLKIANDDKVLSQSDAGLKANVSLRYDSDNSKILLTGVNGTELGSVDTTDFVKDGMIESVAWKEGNENVLVITWNTDAGKEVTELDFAKYIDSYSHYGAGDGLQVLEEDKKYAVKIKEGETFLKVDGNGLYTEGISGAISDAIGELDSTVSATVSTPSTDKVKFVTGVTIGQVDGKLNSVEVEESETYTATAIDTKFSNALDWVVIE